MTVTGRLDEWARVLDRGIRSVEHWAVSPPSAYLRESLYKDLAQLAGLPGVALPVRMGVVFASLRISHYDAKRRGGQIFAALTAGVTGFIMFLAGAHQGYKAYEERRSFYDGHYLDDGRWVGEHFDPSSSFIASFTLVALLNIVIYIVCRRSRYTLTPWRVLSWRISLPAMFFATSPLVKYTDGSQSVLVYAYLGGWVAASTFFWYFIFSLDGRGGDAANPGDRLLLATAGVAAFIHTHSRRRMRNDVRYKACRQLDGLALLAEKDLMWSGRGPRRVRVELRQDALRTAAVYRSHRLSVVRADTRAEADLIVASLMNACAALAAKDFSGLLVNAPESVAERKLFQRILTRLWPSTLFILAGVALPFIPSIAEQPVLADSLRLTLIVTGVLTFVAGQDTASRIVSPLDRVLPWK
ncbi:hypothetical protein [Streptomyces sp. Ag109_O5-10]|uniref:hypothetical protein n=1 Tax=Streptomyces sp. Ag109_O5-10 TaxID=1855349 RepID=UPI000899DA1C|nr:hypothetical protein [Streptomyces sp. Ag109_O5-10]SED57678.1 hypothetical protein SAMN05216533_0004 [Streptomyces sp. Ag109_O5-10]